MDAFYANRIELLKGKFALNFLKSTPFCSDSNNPRKLAVKKIVSTQESYPDPYSPEDNGNKQSDVDAWYYPTLTGNSYHPRLIADYLSFFFYIFFCKPKFVGRLDRRLVQ